MAVAAIAIDSHPATALFSLSLREGCRQKGKHDMRRKLAAAMLAISLIVAIAACDDTPDDGTSTTEAPGTTAGG